MLFQPLNEQCEKYFCDMLSNMNKSFIATVMLIFVTNAFAADVELLHANEWSVPKQTVTVLAMPAINKSMRKLQNDTNSMLKIKYPGGDEGTLWANELRSWLVALGLSSNRIDLIQGSAISTTIELEILSN